MTLTMLLGALAIMLAVIAFVFRRRVGIPIFALAAGSILSTTWADQVTRLLESLGLVLMTPPLSIIVAVIMVLLPAVLLLGSGPVCKKKSLQIAGAIIFGVLGAAFVAEPIVALGLMKTDEIYVLFAQYQPVVLAIGLLVGFVDLLTTKSPKPPKDTGKH